MADPTQTTGLRNDAARSVDRHFRSLYPEVDRPEVFLMGNEDAISYFEEQVKSRVEVDILNEDAGPLSLAWLLAFIMAGYARGQAKANKLISSVSKIEAAPASFGRRFFPLDPHLEVKRMLQKHVFSQVAGTTEKMKKDMTAVITDGILGHKSITDVGEELSLIIDKGKGISRLIARTSIVHAWNLGSIQQIEIYERILNRPIYVIWFTNIDGRERRTHHLRHNRIFTRDQARSLLGERNCRCSTEPYFGDRRPASSIPSSLVS